MKPTFAPKAHPGDRVQIVGQEYPPGSGKVKPWLGLFEAPGYPKLRTDGKDLKRLLEEKWVGRIYNGTFALVVAVSYQDDDKWYYLLNTAQPQGFGWTRSGIRLKKVT